MSHPLDNPLYHALLTGNRSLALGQPPILYFDAQVSPFVGLETHSEANFALLNNLFPAGRKIIVFTNGANIESLPGFEILHRIPGIQMVCTHPSPAVDAKERLVPLTKEWVPQMVELARLTKPGPFDTRTIEFGHYEGVIHGDRLVAMTGQRLLVEGFAEISAVCTHPDFLGRGFARQLMLSQLTRMKAAGHVPFLHVRSDNQRAIALYHQLGFTNRIGVVFHFAIKM